MSIHVEWQLAAIEASQQRIQQCQTPSKAALWIGYDTEGCGCAVNGVVVVQWTDDRETLPRASTWVEAVSTTATEQTPPSIPVLYEPRSEWVLDERLRINYNPDTRRYQLRSDNQIFCV